MKKKANPVLLAMVICDQIIREEGTKKISLLGLFNSIHSKKFPCTHRKMHVFIALTEYQGSANCELRLSSDSESPFVKMTGPLNFPDKLAVVEIDFCFNNIPLPAAGIYHFDFIVNDVLIGHRKFKVGKIKEK